MGSEHNPESGVFSREERERLSAARLAVRAARIARGQDTDAPQSERQLATGAAQPRTVDELAPEREAAAAAIQRCAAECVRVFPPGALPGLVLLFGQALEECVRQALRARRDRPA